MFGSLKVSIGLFSINICNAVQYISSKVRIDFLIYIYIYPFFQETYRLCMCSKLLTIFTNILQNTFVFQIYRFMVLMKEYIT